MNITVAGTGYVGLVTGVCLAAVGHQVICVDTDVNKVKLLKAGIAPIYEPGLDKMMSDCKERLSYTTEYRNAYKGADVIFIGVGTPERSDGSANLDYVYQVVEQVAESIEKDTVVVIKSTVPMGTNDLIEKYLREKLRYPIKVDVASNPEFLSQGTAIRDTLHASRIVIGVQSTWAEEVLRRVYDKFQLPYVVTDRVSAEMIKYASNVFLALKISYVNEVANLCEAVGANIDDVTKGMSYDPRIGDKFLGAGIGYGGSCFPKDTKALYTLAKEHGMEMKTIKASMEVNEEQRMKLLEKLEQSVGTVRDKTIAILGLTFKPNTDDIREAPALYNIVQLLKQGAKLKIYDPIGMKHIRETYQDGVQYCETVDSAISESEVCLIFTEWPQIKEVKPELFVQKMVSPVVIDGRNCFPTNQMKEMGIMYKSIGRPS